MSEQPERCITMFVTEEEMDTLDDDLPTWWRWRRTYSELSDSDDDLQPEQKRARTEEYEELRKTILSFYDDSSDSSDSEQELRSRETESSGEEFEHVSSGEDSEDAASNDDQIPEEQENPEQPPPPEAKPEAQEIPELGAELVVQIDAELDDFDLPGHGSDDSDLDDFDFSDYESYESGFRSDMSIWESDWDSESSWDSDSTETSGVISTTSGSSSSYSSDED